MSTEKIRVRCWPAVGIHLAAHRGSRSGDAPQRAEIRVAGKDLPDGRGVRYWEMQRSSLTGWRVRREVSPLRYWLRLF